MFECYHKIIVLSISFVNNDSLNNYADIKLKQRYVVYNNVF